jgi:hypothetical protein
MTAKLNFNKWTQKIKTTSKKNANACKPSFVIGGKLTTH